jgi:hypothetical protein
LPAIESSFSRDNREIRDSAFSSLFPPFAPVQKFISCPCFFGVRSVAQFWLKPRAVPSNPRLNILPANAAREFADLYCEEREWRGFLSLARPGRPTGTAGPPTGAWLSTARAGSIILA